MKQGYNARMDESLAMRDGAKSQSMAIDVLKVKAWKRLWVNVLMAQ